METAYIPQLRAGLLAWHDENARDLPWRGETDPYRIWVSEIMLQQTRAETVIPYYRRFLADFPDVRALAEAEQDRVLKDWEGLGYYSRARNLHRAAKQVTERLDGQFPRDAQGLRALPGIGEYTAGAIASMAYGLPEPAIDGNQIRVLSRLFLVEGVVNRPEAKRALRAWALQLIDQKRPGDFNQALMGLGALICLPRKPDCARCPARAHCRANALGAQARLPLLPEPTARRTERRGVALVFLKGRVLVRQRPQQGLLAGLFEFPNFLDARRDADMRAALAELGVRVRAHQAGEKLKHVFTHLVWNLTGHLYEAEPGARGLFVDARALDALPMPAPMQKYRETALKRMEDK